MSLHFHNFLWIPNIGSLLEVESIQSMWNTLYMYYIWLLRSMNYLLESNSTIGTYIIHIVQESEYKNKSELSHAFPYLEL